MWFEGLLAVWTAVGAITSIAVQHWFVAVVSGLTAVGAGTLWWLSRGSLRRIPETREWAGGQA
jgi:hypothetical protein